VRRRMVCKESIVTAPVLVIVMLFDRIFAFD
jgi:hypothetical protein